MLPLLILEPRLYRDGSAPQPARGSPDGECGQTGNLLDFLGVERPPLRGLDRWALFCNCCVGFVILLLVFGLLALFASVLSNSSPMLANSTSVSVSIR